eukprot:CAMPEP_0175974640 /NCGR_PEP_ID=MMETSP0108-20121206/43490_1 /TAXON_ID=195067 ORGANISM="Goniomonas pacifica, Strain CCMP1869" /NCGR_SAMPLE_ID=MMETSP0108 /ASSEMBLY_ACC=CAM_ASM_000204 /LENGTH=232 /DNA_ID=CAMNT_0017304277 /DNA_START=54 /DNA_END=752 /DNA_ORIENTATION=+
MTMGLLFVSWPLAWPLKSNVQLCSSGSRCDGQKSPPHRHLSMESATLRVQQAHRPLTRHFVLSSASGAQGTGSTALGAAFGGSCGISFGAGRFRLLPPQRNPRRMPANPPLVLLDRRLRVGGASGLSWGLSWGVPGFSSVMIALVLVCVGCKSRCGAASPEVSSEITTSGGITNSAGPSTCPNCGGKDERSKRPSEVILGRPLGSERTMLFCSPGNCTVSSTASGCACFLVQ